MPSHFRALLSRTTARPSVQWASVSPVPSARSCHWPVRVAQAATPNVASRRNATRGFDSMGGDEKSFANPSSEQPTRRVGVPGPVGSHMACGTTIPWKTPPMELRQLRYFVKVVEHGSFSQAAAALGVVTLALSQQISRLEGELSTRLPQRTSKGVLPTDAGLAFWRQAQLALRHADHAVLAAQGWSVLPLLQERLCAMGLRGLPGPPTTAQPAGQFVGRRTGPRRAGHPRGVDRGGSFAGGRGPLDRRLVSRILKPPCRDRSGGQPAACLQCRQA